MVRDPSDMFDAWGRVPAWSPTTALEHSQMIEGQMIEAHMPQETSPSSTSSSQLANLMELEHQRQKHIRDACAFLTRMQVSKLVGIAHALFHMLSTHIRLFCEMRPIDRQLKAT